MGIYANHEGTHIFDLVQTAAWLNRACYYCMQAASKGAKFLWVGTKDQAKDIVKKAAEETGSWYATERFVGGMLSNFKARQESLAKMQKASQQPVVKKTWDPWLFSLDRYRRLRRRSLRQPWHIQQY